MGGCNEQRRASSRGQTEPSHHTLSLHESSAELGSSGFTCPHLPDERHSNREEGKVNERDGRLDQGQPSLRTPSESVFSHKKWKIVEN